MEISYRSLIEYNALRTLRATEDKIIETFDNPFSHLEYEYLFKDINENIVRGQVGDDRWNSIGSSLLVAAFILYFALIVFLPAYSRVPVVMAIYGILLLCSVASFVMRLYKEEWVWFHNKNNNQVMFVIKITSDNRDKAEGFILHIREKIKDLS